MKKLPLIFLSILFLFSFVSCQKDVEKINSLKKNETYAVIAVNGVALRLDPLLYSAKIAELPASTLVKVVDKSKEKCWIGGKSDYWLKIETKTGLTGWSFAPNIKILGNDEKSVQKYVKKQQKIESEKIRKMLVGKWWSVNRYQNFTGHGLEIAKSGEYYSYTKGKEEEPFEGTVTIDVDKRKIVFSDKTSFNQDLYYIVRGKKLFLQDKPKNQKLKLMRIGNVSTKRVQSGKDTHK